MNNYTSALLLLVILLGCNLVALASENDLRVDVVTGPVMAIEGDGNTLWVGTAKGLFTWDDAPGSEVRQIPADTGVVRVLLRDGDTLWVGSEKGLFRWDNPGEGGVPRLVPGSPKSITKLYKFGPKLLIGATGGLFVWQDAPPRRLTHFASAGRHVNVFYEDFDTVWIGSDIGLLSWNGAGREPVPVPLGINVNVTGVYKEGAVLLVGTSSGLFRWANGPPGSPELISDSNVYSLYKDVSTLLINETDKGLLRLDDVGEGKPEIIDSEIGISSKYYKNGSKYYKNGPVLWMGAGHIDQAGLFRWNEQAEQKPRRVAGVNTGYVHCFYKGSDTLWIGGENGLFRVKGLDTDWDAGIRITGQLPKDINPGQGLLIKWQVGNFGWRTTPQQAQYRVIVKDDGGREVRPGGWEVVGSQELTLPSLPEGKYSLYVQATDLNDKVAESQPISISVTSWESQLFGWLKVIVLACALVIGILIAITTSALFLAPHSIFFHNLLMSPMVRNVGSLGVIPLALRLPRVRRHILKQYLDGVGNDKEFSDRESRFVIPTEDFSPESFGTLLSDKRRLLLLGQPGIGKTSYLKYLAGHYARRPDTPPTGVIPVFIPLADCRGESPENMFSAQMAAFGRLSDEELNKFFLRRGGFVVLIDGLNETDAQTRNKVKAFVDQHQGANYFCLSSEQEYQEFADVDGVRLPALGEDKIKDLLLKRLDGEQAAATVKQLEGDTGGIYGIPQNLGLAVELRKRNSETHIPRSKTGLYGATLDNALARCGEGYPRGALYKRAWNLWKERRRRFTPDGELASADIEPLLEADVVIARDGQFEFRHNLMLGYLAACWPTLGAGSTAVTIERLSESGVWNLSHAEQDLVFPFLAELIGTREGLEQIAQFAEDEGDVRIRLSSACREAAKNKGWAITPAPDDPYGITGIVLDDKYKLIRFVKAGGMGAVYRSRSLSDGKIVAVKILKPDMVARNPEYVGLFEREVANVRGLDHPHIVRVTDSGQYSGQYNGRYKRLSYMVMDWVDGVPVDAVLRRGRLSLDRVTDIFGQVCGAVGFAHQKKIIHLDIKPANILLVDDAQPGDFVKVIDFGLSRVISRESGTTVTKFGGTHQYCAPEQYGGKVSPRSDVYSLGVTLYELLTGVIPFGSSYINAKMHPNLELPEIPSVTRMCDAPPGVDQVIRKALNKDPALRQQSAGQLFEEFSEALRSHHPAPLQSS
jgi:hypothetical protein